MVEPEHDSRQEVFAQCRSSCSGCGYEFDRSKIVPIIRQALPGSRTLGSVQLTVQRRKNSPCYTIANLLICGRSLDPTA
jgi:hypothetical protein